MLVTTAQLTSPRDELVELGELDEADRRLHVGHPEVEAHLRVLFDHRLAAGVTLRGAHVHAVLAQPAQPGGDILMRSDEHAAFARREELAWVEGKGS